MNAKRSITVLVIFLLASLIALLPASYAVAAKPTVTVNGGGMAVVIEGRALPEGAVTEFAVGAHLREDGTASGHFTCEIPGVVTVSGDIKQGEANADGSVTFRGLATFVDLEFGIFRDEPFTVTLWEGGPGVGRFLYDDTVVPDPGDLEEVVTGQIQIH